MIEKEKQGGWIRKKERVKNEGERRTERKKEEKKDGDKVKKHEKRKETQS